MRELGLVVTKCETKRSSFNCISRGEATNLLRSDTRSAESSLGLVLKFH